MQNYLDIIGEIAVNLGWESSVEKNINRIRNAILWAEQQILGKSRGVKFFERIVVDKDHDSYFLPPDFNTHSKVIITDRNLNRYLTQELEFEQLISYETQRVPISVQSTDLAINPKYVSQTIKQVEDDARWYGKMLYAIKRTADGYEISLKPKVDGFIFIYYSAIAEIPKDLEAKRPSMPQRFWYGIVAGATYYELRRVIMNETDQNKILAIRSSMKEYASEMQDVIADLAGLQQDRAEPAIVKPFTIGDTPENYV